MNLIKFANFAIISILSTSNNTLITATNTKGYLFFFYSSGYLGMKGAKRSTVYSSQNVGYLVGKKLLFLGYKFVYVKIKGFGFGRFPSLKGLYYSGLKILYIFDVTGFSFNGCKKSKNRRL